MERKLSPTERVIWMADQVGCVNAVMTAHLLGPLDDLVLRGALDVLAQRHPPLGVRVQVRGETPFLVSENVPPIPLRVILRQDDEQWHVEAEKELNDPLPLSVGPLLRVVLIKSEARSELLLTCHHIITDAKAGNVLVSEILDLVRQIAEGNNHPAIAAVAEHPPLEKLLPRGIEGRSGMMKAAALIIKQLVNLLISRPRKLPRDSDALPQDRCSRFIPRFLSTQETESLITRCREEGTTVHGLVCAAMLKATAQQIYDTLPSSRSVTLNCSSPVDLRPVLSRPIENEVGNFVSMVVTTHPVSAKTDLWDLARAVKSAVRRSVAREEPVISLALLDRFMPAKITPTKLVKNLSKVHSAMAVSNLGVLDIPDRYGAIVLRRIDTALSTRAFPENVVACIGTFRNQLGINIYYSEPTLSRTRITRLMDDAMQTLQHAASLPATIPSVLADKSTRSKALPVGVTVKGKLMPHR